VTVALKQIREQPAAPRTIEPDLPVHLERAILKEPREGPGEPLPIRGMTSCERSKGSRRAKFHGRPSRDHLAVSAVAAGVLVPGRSRLLVLAAGAGDSDSLTFPLEQFTARQWAEGGALGPTMASPTIHSQRWPIAGVSVANKPGHAGLAHLAEHVMFSRFAERRARRIPQPGERWQAAL
jgi:hypothetical protein